MNAFDRYIKMVAHIRSCSLWRSVHTQWTQTILIADGSSNKPFLEIYEQGIQPCHITPPADSITQTTKKKNQFLTLVADYKAF